MHQVLEDKGVCLFAYNTPELDYIKLAVICAQYVKRHLGLPVCLITDVGGDAWLHQSHDQEVIDACIDYIVETDDEMKPNVRQHYDSPWTEFKSQFNNSNKHRVWDYSPFEKTLLLDTDYIVKTDFLNTVMDTQTGVAMFDRAITLRNEEPLPGEVRLNEIGIPMWWSTVIYFDRSPISELFFNTWAHIADNYEYYQHMYNFPGHLFRTDYCVSIAVHILNGMQAGDVINNMFDLPMQNMSAKDDFVGLESDDVWFIFAHDRDEPWKNLLVKHTDYDVHIMNKRSWARNYDSYMENGAYQYVK